ncbi:MAG: hypothetical protein GXP47_11840, partial [Acidobacteria bacterium]|nr:hypothetical protein [Acidobacteriota bacterium]
RPEVPMAILSAAVVLDIVLNIVLIPGYQVTGAAMASTLSFAAAGTLSVAALWRHLGTHTVPGPG